MQRWPRAAADLSWRPGDAPEASEPRGATTMSRQNYFNTLTMAQKLDQLGRCRFMDRSEFNGVEKLRGKKVVIVGCGAQGLNQGLNMRDSGLDISYALRADAIEQKRVSFTNATNNGFKVGTYEQLIPTAPTKVFRWAPAGTPPPPAAGV